MTERRNLVQPKDARGNDANDWRDDPEFLSRLEPMNDTQADDQPKSGSAVALGDFRAHMPDHKYIFIPTRDLWPAVSVDSRVKWPTDSDGKPMKPSRWIDQHAPVEQMTWAPGEPMVIRDRLMDAGGWLSRRGVSVFNMYRAPACECGDRADVAQWLDHINGLYPNEADHIVKWFAQRVQKPGIKINHALVLGGPQGIGKDTILEPLKYAVGPWNFNEVAPAVLLGRFNSFVKSVVLRVSEARDLGDVDRFAFYDHMKTYTAAPPDVLRCDEKNVREYAALNVCGVIITTNHKSDGIYLPEDDRRHFVCWTGRQRDEYPEGYWRDLWQWYCNGGIANVAAYLASLDISDFDPKAPPPKTEAFWHIVSANRSAEESGLADVIEAIGKPDAFTVAQLAAHAQGRDADLWEFLTDRKYRRQIPHKLEAVGYESVTNPAAKDGYWKIAGRRQPVYADRTLTTRDKLAAASRLSRVLVG